MYLAERSFVGNHYADTAILSITALLAGYASASTEEVINHIAFMAAYETHNGVNSDNFNWLELLETEKVIKVQKLELMPNWLQNYISSLDKSPVPEGKDFTDFYTECSKLLKNQKSIVDLDDKLGVDMLTNLEGGIKVYFSVTKEGRAECKRLVDEYLDKFDGNLLYLNTAIEPWPYFEQQLYLDELIAAKTMHGNNIVSISDVDVRERSDSGIKRFMLAESVLSRARKGDISLIMLGVDYQNLDEDNVGQFYCRFSMNVPIKFERLPSGLKKHAVAKIDGSQVYVGIKGEELVPVGKPVRFGGTAYNFLHFMQNNTKREISKLDVQEVPGCRSYDDMTELVRNSRFDKDLKKIFFEGTTRNQAKFTPEKELTQTQYEAFLVKLDKIRAKNETIRK